MNSSGPVDAIDMVRQIRDVLYEQTKSLSTEELIQFYRQRAAGTKERLSQLHAGEKK